MTGPDTRRPMVRLAQAGVVVFVLAVPVTNMVNTLTWPGPAVVSPVVVVACTVLQLSLVLWLVWPAVHGRRPAGVRWVLVGLAVLLVGGTVWAGADWVLAYGSFGLAALLVLRAPWSWLVFGAIVASTAPALWALGFPPDPAQVAFVLQATLGLAPFVLIELVGAVRRLDAARAALASDAVMQERLRIDDDLRRTVRPELAVIAATAEQASAPGLDVLAVERRLREIVGASRGSLAAARRLIGEYRRGSLRGELDTAVGLLRAAGIQTWVEDPTDVVSGSSDHELRSTVRQATAELLRAPDVQHCVIRVIRRGDRLVLEVSADARHLTRAEVRVT